MKLREARNKAGITQEQAARESGISVNGFRKLERGEVGVPQLSTVFRLAQALGVDPHEVDEFAATLEKFEAGNIYPKTASRSERPSDARLRLAENYGVTLPAHEEAKANQQDFEARLRGLDPEIHDAIERKINRQVAARLREVADRLDEES